MSFDTRVNRDVAAEVRNEEIFGVCDCGTRWTGEAICHCSLCHLTFVSIGGFDKHRIGRMGSRRCRTPDELRKCGLEPNDLGQWRRPMTERARERLPAR